MIDYFNYKDFTLFYNDRNLLNLIEKDLRDSSACKDLLNEIFILSQEDEKIKLNIEECRKLSQTGAKYLQELIFNIVQYNKKYSINNDWEIYKGEYVIIKFDYHPYLVNKVKQLKSSKYLSEKKQWSVHISEWRELQKIFGNTNFKIEQLYLEWKIKNAKNKLIITEKTCQLLGNNLPIDVLYSENAFDDINAKHTFSYKNGNWDGKIALFDKNTRMFPIGILQKVRNILDYYKVPYVVEDLRIEPKKQFSFKENVKLRDYQEYVVDKAIRAKRGILQLATGAGKTKIACSIISRLGLKSIFFVHTHFLLSQAKTELENVLGESVGQIGGGIVDIKNVSVAMIQTTIKAFGKEYIPSVEDEDSEQDFTDINGKEDLIKQLLQDVDVVFFDECQFVAAESFYIIANACNAYYKYGLSATPYRSDKKDPMIIAALGQIVARVTASYLIKRGFLTKPKIHFFKIGNNNQNDKRKYPTVYKENIVESIERNNKIVFATKRLIEKNRSVLILVQQISHGELLQKLFQNEGIDVEFVSGINDTKKREREVQRLKNKQSLCLIASTIADEGLDIPSLDAVILAGAGKSPSKELQRVGRALRKFTRDNILYEIDKILKKEKDLNFGINCSEEWMDILKEKYSNIFFPTDNLYYKADKYIYINYYEKIEQKNYLDIIEITEDIDINNGIVFCKTKKEISFLKKLLREKNKNVNVVNNIQDATNAINLIKSEDLKMDLLYAQKVFKNIYSYNLDIPEECYKKEYYIFNEKTEAFIVDFFDNVKFLSEHSNKRYLMLKTESEFQISGI